MPEFINGYEVFQLCHGKGPSESIAFTELSNSLGNGYESGVRFGERTGDRSWQLNFPTLAGSISQTSVSISGMTLTPADYVWDFFCRHKETGKPFVITSARNGQYYLARFPREFGQLTYNIFLAKLFASQLVVKQARVPGVSVWDVSKLTSVKARFLGQESLGPFGLAWSDELGNPGWNVFPDASTAGIEGIEDAQNGRYAFELEAGDEEYFYGGPTQTIYDLLIVMMVTEATFNSHAGVLTSDVTSAALVGNSGTTKFFNLAFGDGYTYSKNGVYYAENDQQAPMEEWGLIHCRWEEGRALQNMQVGADRDFGNRFLNAQIGEIVMTGSPTPLSDIHELAEAMNTEWAL